MILETNIKRILCFGDSNTWGQNEDKSFADRYPLSIRWTGRVQTALGSNYEIYEEGLGGRNTNFDHYDPSKTSRNGLMYFMPYLESHEQFDVVVIMLGTNDLKIQYQKTVSDIALSLEQYINFLQKKFPSTKILVMAPPFINDKAPKFQSYYADTYNSDSVGKSKLLKTEFEALAKDKKIHFINVAEYVMPGADGLHLSAEAHEVVAEIVASKIQEILT